jgi:hypothetical protein
MPGNLTNYRCRLAVLYTSKLCSPCLDPVGFSSIYKYKYFVICLLVLFFYILAIAGRLFSLRLDSLSIWKTIDFLNGRIKRSWNIEVLVSGIPTTDSNLPLVKEREERNKKQQPCLRNPSS